MAKALSLEESFQQLDEIIGQLEQEDITLEQSFQLYQTGMKLIQTCNRSIDKVEKKIIVLDHEQDTEQME